MTSSKLSVDSIVKHAFEVGFQNFFPLIGTLVLYVITFWIPYVNVGTTIGLNRMVLDIAKGKTIAPKNIFQKDNYEYMGRYFILWALMLLGVLTGYLFLIIPGIVISLHWMLASVLILDKDMTPYESLQESAKLTKGSRWAIFGGLIVLMILMGVLLFILGLILEKLFGNFGSGLGIIINYCIYFVVCVGAHSYIYRELVKPKK